MTIQYKNAQLSIDENSNVVNMKTEDGDRELGEWDLTELLAGWGQDGWRLVGQSVLQTLQDLKAPADEDGDEFSNITMYLTFMREVG